MIRQNNRTAVRAFNAAVRFSGIIISSSANGSGNAILQLRAVGDNIVVLTCGDRGRNFLTGDGSGKFASLSTIRMILLNFYITHKFQIIRQSVREAGFFGNIFDDITAVQPHSPIDIGVAIAAYNFTGLIDRAGAGRSISAAADIVGTIVDFDRVGNTVLKGEIRIFNVWIFDAIGDGISTGWNGFTISTQMEHGFAICAICNTGSKAGSGTGSGRDLERILVVSPAFAAQLIRQINGAGCVLIHLKSNGIINVGSIFGIIVRNGTCRLVDGIVASGLGIIILFALFDRDCTSPIAQMNGFSSIGRTVRIFVPFEIELQTAAQLIAGTCEVIFKECQCDMPVTICVLHVTEIAGSNAIVGRLVNVTFKSGAVHTRGQIDQNGSVGRINGTLQNMGKIDLAHYLIVGSKLGRGLPDDTVHLVELCKIDKAVDGKASDGGIAISDFVIQRSHAVISLLRICHRHQRCHLRSVQRDFSHLAVHIAGDHGQGAGIFVHIAHDANGAGIHGVFLNVGCGAGGSRSIHGEQGNVGIGGIVLHLQRFALHGHSLGHGAIVDHDITGHCGIKRQITVKIHGIAAAGLFVVQRAAQLAVQRQHTGNLRDSALGDAGIVQAVGEEHHIPRAVGIAVPCTVAGIIMYGGAVGIVQLKVFLALLIAQLALGYGQQVVHPQAGQGGAGLAEPFVLVLRAVQRVGQTVHRVVMLRQAADQHFLVAGIGVVVHRGLDHRIDHHGLCSHRLLKQGHRVIIGVHFFYKLALFQTAHQLIGGGVAAVVVGVLEQITDQAAVLRVKAVVGVLVLFFPAGQLLHFLIAVVGVLMGHKDVLRLCGIGCNAGIIRIHAERIIIHAECIIKRHAVVRHGGVPVLRFTFLIAAHQLLFIAGSGVLVLHLAAQIFGRFGNAHAVQLPVHEQAGGKRQCQQQRSIASGALVVPTELFLIFFHNIPHDS